ncbi:MAG: hypothetical protein ACLUOI_11285 [Eisenbergiella sp.]
MTKTNRRQKHETSEEIIHVVGREEYIRKHLNPSERIAQILWIHGIRNQFYYSLNDLILMSFEYVGREFTRIWLPSLFLRR